MSELEHLCKVLLLRKGQHTQESIRLIKYQWVYETKLFASPKWVQDGEADYVGELIFGCSFTLNYCPFCGDKLTEDEANWVSTEEKQESQPVDVHQCELLTRYNKEHSDEGTSIDRRGRWCITKDSSKGWWLMRRYAIITEQIVTEKLRVAREKDIGKERFLHGFGIRYCPFCGEKAF